MKVDPKAAPPTRYPEVGTPVLLGFCAYILIWFLQVGIRKDILGTIRIELLVAASLGAAALLFHPPKPRFKPETSPLPWYVAALFAAMVVQLPFSQDPLHSIDVFRDRVVKFAFMAFFLASFVRSPKGLRYFLAAFLLACLYITQESFRGALDGSMIWENQGVPRLHGDTPLFRHPNSLAGLAIGVLPFAYFLFFTVRPKIWRWPLALVTMTAGGCVMYSGSRTAYVALGVFAGYLWLFSKHKARFVLAGILVSAVAWPVLPEAYQKRFLTIFTGEDIEGHSIDTRKEILRDAMEVFRKYPLGVGVSAFPAVRMRLFDREQDTHNLYLEVATNLGVQGFVVFALFIWKMMASFLATKKSLDRQIARMEAALRGPAPPGGAAAHLEDLNLLRATALAITGYIVIRLALGLFGMDLYEIYWWIGTGLALALFNIDQYARRITDELAGAAPAAPPPGAGRPPWARG